MAGSSNSAQKAAQAQQQQQQAQITQAQSQINNVFDNPQRQADIHDFVTATKQYYDQDLDRQKADADRQLKFALAKSGLTGGSVNVDQQRLLGENYNRGQLQAEQKALGAGANLEAQDQAARARLISLATQGLDATTGAQQAAAALQSNLQAGRSAQNLGELGNIFGTFNEFSKNADAAQQKRQAQLALAQQGFYGSTPAVSGYGG